MEESLNKQRQLEGVNLLMGLEQLRQNNKFEIREASTTTELAYLSNISAFSRFLILISTLFTLTIFMVKYIFGEQISSFAGLLLTQAAILFLAASAFGIVQAFFEARTLAKRLGRFRRINKLWSTPFWPAEISMLPQYLDNYEATRRETELKKTKLKVNLLPVSLQAVALFLGSAVFILAII